MKWEILESDVPPESYEICPRCMTWLDKPYTVLWNGDYGCGYCSACCDELAGKEVTAEELWISFHGWRFSTRKNWYTGTGNPHLTTEFNTVVYRRKFGWAYTVRHQGAYDIVQRSSKINSYFGSCVAAKKAAYLSLLAMQQTKNILVFE